MSSSCIHFHERFINVTDTNSSPLLHTNYVEWVTCLGPGGLVPLAVVLIAFLLFLKSTADDYLSGTLSVICTELQLSHEIAGATLLALGNGAPDVFSSIAAFSSDSNGANADLGIASLLGGAAFVTTIVLGSVAISASEDTNGVEIKLETFGRDALFLIMGVLWLCVLSQTVVNIFTSIVFLILEGIYVFVVIRQARQKTPTRCFGDDEEVDEPLMSLSQDEQDHQERLLVPEVFDDTTTTTTTTFSTLNEDHFAPPVPPPLSSTNPFSSSFVPSPTTTTNTNKTPPSFFNAMYWRQLRLAKHAHSFGIQSYKEFKNLSHLHKILYVIQLPLTFLRALTVPPPEPEAWSKTLVALHPPMCLLLIMWVHWGEALGSTATVVFVLILVMTLFSSFVIYLNLHAGRPPTAKSSRLALSFTSFCMCVIWIEVSATEIVSILDTMGIALGANSSIMGLSVLAWGNSVGDLITNVSVSKAGFPAMAVSACVAGPVFNLLVGLGLSLVVLSVKRHTQSLGSFTFELDKYSTAAAWLLVSVLCFTLMISRLNHNRISKNVGAFLVLTYAMFILGAMIALLFW